VFSLRFLVFLCILRFRIFKFVLSTLQSRSCWQLINSCLLRGLEGSLLWIDIPSFARSPASVPDLCISSRPSLPKEGVSFLLSSSRAFCKGIRVASEIRPLVLIQTSVVIEWVANSSLPSRHLPLCRLHLPSALAIL